MMASFKDWMEGARVRTLPAALAPVIVGAALAYAMNEFSWKLTLLAAGVALLFQIGVNFANDYSDGIRGTDDVREGPTRLTGSGTVKPGTVKLAAFISFGLACACGLAVTIICGHWWLIAVGAAAVLAGWFYTGGKHPYGYMGLGEVFVLAFFGYAATVGTVYIQTDQAPLLAWILATAIGLIACAILMVNNIRDIPGDEAAGKKTLAVRIGETKARWSYYCMLALAVVLASSMYLWGFGLAAGMTGMLVWVVLLARPVIAGASGHALLSTLRNTGIFELVFAIVVATILIISIRFPLAYFFTLGWSIAIGVWAAWLLIEGFTIIRLRARIRATASSQEDQHTEAVESSDEVHEQETEEEESAPALESPADNSAASEEYETRSDKTHADEIA